jgi:hypothetical protein
MHDFINLGVNFHRAGFYFFDRGIIFMADTGDNFNVYYIAFSFVKALRSCNSAGQYNFFGRMFQLRGKDSRWTRCPSSLCYFNMETAWPEISTLFHFYNLLFAFKPNRKMISGIQF